MNNLHIDVSLANERLHQSPPNLLTQCVTQLTQMSFIFKILICIFHFTLSIFYSKPYSALGKRSQHISMPWSCHTDRDYVSLVADE